MGGTDTSVTRESSSAAKIALFRSLFRGRDDVYARRFERSKTGRSGYAPACANEWVRGEVWARNDDETRSEEEPR